MDDNSLYSAILGLSSQWRISDVTIDEQSGITELHICSKDGSKFSCPTCGATKLPSRVSKARWLHENRLNIRLVISALIPIIVCERCGEMKVGVPWKPADAPCVENVPTTKSDASVSPENRSISAITELTASHSNKSNKP
ncbi:MAG: hypothetical protein HXX11_18935 [Desulfuromonadales bacterium]|nr:hypothetical protein [Desulfuromonadales bacterium]